MAARIVFLVLVAVFSWACRGADPRAVEKAALSVDSRSRPDSGAYRLSPGEVVSPVFVSGRSRTTIHKESNQTVYLDFHSQEGKLLRGSLHSKDPDANLRISQIIMPDGTSDGPFGWNIIYELPETGTYRLAIHENMMAGEPWEGDFKVELALK